MDTLTHALSGALLARATHRRAGLLSLRERTLAGFVAAGFPDLDYLLILVAPLDFLNWHRGPTHSLVLLPAWALLLAVTFAWLAGNRHRWRSFYGVCALGLAAHICGDVITLYGTQLLYPLSDAPLGLGIVFDVDPYIAAMIAAGFLGALGARPARSAAVTLAVVLVYLALQTLFEGRTVAVGEAYARARDLGPARVEALPQPLAPFLWKVVVIRGDAYDVAHVNHLARQASAVPDEAWLLRRMIAAYRPVQALHWRRYRRFGDAAAFVSLARKVWNQNGFAAFRRFAVLPLLYRVDREPEQECVWFTDLRHILPALPPPFRYGMCRTRPQGKWRLYRLRYFRDDDRQALG